MRAVITRYIVSEKVASVVLVMVRYSVVSIQFVVLQKDCGILRVVSERYFDQSVYGTVKMLI